MRHEKEEEEKIKRIKIKAEAWEREQEITGEEFIKQLKGLKKTKAPGQGTIENEGVSSSDEKNLEVWRNPKILERT